MGNSLVYTPLNTEHLRYLHFLPEELLAENILYYFYKVHINYPEESDISLTNKGYVNISIVLTDPFCNSVDDVKLVL